MSEQDHPCIGCEIEEPTAGTALSRAGTFFGSHVCERHREEYCGASSPGEVVEDAEQESEV